MDSIPPTSLICTGVLLSGQLELVLPPIIVTSHVVWVPSVVVPSPSWPNQLLPQAHTVPSSFSARLWELPAVRAFTPLRWPEGSLGSFTSTGVLLSVFVPSPSSPSWFKPQAQTVPSFFRARLWLAPPAMAFNSAPSRLLTSSGMVLRLSSG